MGRPKTLNAAIKQLSLNENIAPTRENVLKEISRAFLCITTFNGILLPDFHPSAQELEAVKNNLTERFIEYYDQRLETAHGYDCIVVNDELYSVTETEDGYLLENDDEEFEVDDWVYQQDYLPYDDEEWSNSARVDTVQRLCNDLKSQIWNQFIEYPYFAHWSQLIGLSDEIMNNNPPGLKARLRQYRMGVLIATSPQITAIVRNYVHKMLPTVELPNNTTCYKDLIKTAFCAPVKNLHDLSLEYTTRPAISGTPSSWHNASKAYMSSGSMANALYNNPKSIFFMRASWLYSTLFKKVRLTAECYYPKYLEIDKQLARFEIPPAYKHLGPINSWSDMEKMMDVIVGDLIEAHKQWLD